MSNARTLAREFIRRLDDDLLSGYDKFRTLEDVIVGLKEINPRVMDDAGQVNLAIAADMLKSGIVANIRNNGEMSDEVVARFADVVLSAGEGSPPKASPAKLAETLKAARLPDGKGNDLTVLAFLTTNGGDQFLDLGVVSTGAEVDMVVGMLPPEIAGIFGGLLKSSLEDPMAGDQKQIDDHFEAAFNIMSGGSMPMIHAYWSDDPIDAQALVEQTGETYYAWQPPTLNKDNLEAFFDGAYRGTTLREDGQVVRAYSGSPVQQDLQVLAYDGDGNAMSAVYNDRVKLHNGVDISFARQDFDSMITQRLIDTDAVLLDPDAWNAFKAQYNADSPGFFAADYSARDFFNDQARQIMMGVDIGPAQSAKIVEDMQEAGVLEEPLSPQAEAALREYLEDQVHGLQIQNMSAQAAAGAVMNFIIEYNEDAENAADRIYQSGTARQYGHAYNDARAREVIDEMSDALRNYAPARSASEFSERIQDFVQAAPGLRLGVAHAERESPNLVPFTRDTDASVPNLRQDFNAAADAVGVPEQEVAITPVEKQATVMAGEGIQYSAAASLDKAGVSEVLDPDGDGQVLLYALDGDGIPMLADDGQARALSDIPSNLEVRSVFDENDMLIWVEVNERASDQVYYVGAQDVDMAALHILGDHMLDPNVEPAPHIDSEPEAGANVSVKPDALVF